MAVELYGNGGETTLSAAVDNLVTTLPVTSAAGFPSGTGQYRIRVGNELMIVTGGIGTTSWTVTRGAEGTTAASHASGAAVRHVLTAGALPASLHASRSFNVAAGGNNTLTLGAAPYGESLQVFVDGIMKRPGKHYTVSGSTITFTAALRAGQVVSDYYLTNTPAPVDSALSGSVAPTSIADLQLWLDASQLEMVDGATMGRWDDLSGASRHGTAVGGPTYRSSTAIVALPNGKPVVEFDGVDDRFDLPNFLSYTAGTGFAVMAVDVDPPATGEKTGPPFGDWGSSADASHYPFTDGIIYDAFGSSARKSTGNPAAALTAYHVYTVVTAASDWRSYINGAAHFSTTTNVVAWRTTPRIGYTALTATPGKLDGRIAEVLFYSRALPTAEQDAVQAYLRNKYATP